MRTETEIGMMIAKISKKYDSTKYAVHYDRVNDKFIVSPISGNIMKATKPVKRTLGMKRGERFAEIATDFFGEIWKPVNWGGGGLSKEYVVSNMGRVAKLGNAGEKRLLVEYDYTNNGMCQANLNEEDGTRHCISIHHIVAEAFLPNPNKLSEIVHINGDYKNNAVSNLAWV